jgi:hypothetical protein
MTLVMIVLGENRFDFEKLLSVRMLLLDEGGLLGLALLLLVWWVRSEF